MTDIITIQTNIVKLENIITKNSQFTIESLYTIHDHALLNIYDEYIHIYVLYNIYDIKYKLVFILMCTWHIYNVYIVVKFRIKCSSRIQTN